MEFKTRPFQHQLREFELHRDKETWGLFWEMGCGKSKALIDNMAWFALEGRARGALILAPNGVHRNWLTDELPAHLPEQVAESTVTHLWETSKSRTNRHASAAERVLKHQGFSVVSMSYNAFMTTAGAKYAKTLLTDRPCFYLLDESPRIKTPGSQTTKRVQASSKYAALRRIATGTLVDDSPFDVYSQIRFLDKEAWRHLGISTPFAFRTYFGEYVKDYNHTQGRQFDRLVGYRNLDRLSEVVSQHGTRWMKDQVLDLPPKLYTKRYFEMSRSQARLYKELREDFMTYLDDGGILSAPLGITRMLRLQQVTSGYLPSDDDSDLRPIDEKNPRIQLLLSTLEEVAGEKVIVWAKYRQDIDLILAALQWAKIEAVRYDGACSSDQLAESKERFKHGSARVFVSNPAVGREGLTLNEAKTVVYYNNSFKLNHRVQSEDRCHRIGQDTKVLYVDLAASGTIDDYIVLSLRKKRELAAIGMGDEIREWI